MLVFVHMHKTGGTTVSHILRNSHGLAHCQVEPWHAKYEGPPFSSDDLQRLRKIYPKLKSIAGHRITADVNLFEWDEDVRYFTFMRDPLKLCASRYQFRVNIKQKKDLTFEEWIKKDWPRNHQTKWIAGTEDVDKAIKIIEAKNIFVGLTERFDESMVLLKARIAQELNISYKRVNVAQDNSIKDYLLSNEETRQMLIEAQQADLELYSFVKSELYPKYQMEYGPLLEQDVTRYQQTQSNKFNFNLTLCRLKHYTIYKPLLYLNRRGLPIV